VNSVNPLTKVLIVDDHAAVAAALSMAIDRSGDMTCLGAVGGLEEALERLAQEAADVVVVDINLGTDVTGVEVTRAVKARYPATRVVVLTATADFEVLVAAASAGASGYVLKEQDLPEVLQALRSSHASGILVDPSSLRRMDGSGSPAAPDSRDGANGPAYLTTRELEILRMLSAGKDVKSIGRSLGIAVNTCRGHLKSLFIKLDAHSQLEAVTNATRLGLLPPMTQDQRS